MTTKPREFVSPLVERLLAIARSNDRGRLSALRTGLGKKPGEAPRMLPIVAPFLSDDVGPRTEAAFLTAALFASHPEHASIGTLGASLRKATSKHGMEGMEVRFAAALDADPEDLPHHLRGLVSLCESAGVPIDWHRFERDVRGLLGHDDDYRVRIRTRWAREFWRGPKEPKTTDQDTE